MKTKSQLWSLDSVIASVVFVTSAVIIILIVSMSNLRSDYDSTERESTILNQLISGNPRVIDQTRGASASTNVFSFLSGSNINNEKLKFLQDYSYNELRDGLGFKTNFCIYFEDLQGNLINLSNYTGSDSVGIGHNGTKFIIHDGNDKKVIYCSTK